MFELIDNQPELDVQESEYRRLLGYPPDHVLEGRARELADWASRWYRENGKPWVYARQTGDVEIANGHLQIDGKRIASSQLREQWLEVEADLAVLAAVSAGKQCEEKARQLWEEGKPDEYFFLETYGSAVVEHLITATGGRICAWAEPQGRAALPHYSPGYSGWDIADQIPLFELVERARSAEWPGELRVLESGMLQPKKSLLAVFGLTRQVDKMQRFARWIPCENCALAGCQYRRVPYAHWAPQLEEARRLQPRPPDTAARGARPESEATYTVNLRALRKWARERLLLKQLPDGSIEARFRYEGTTCSNLGRPLEFHYHVKLRPPNEAHRICELSCVPAPGDTGHTCMCEYLKDAEALMACIAKEKPLLGMPLSAALRWDRASSPAGCHCDAASRLHKWGLVFEVIHYALYG